MINTNVANTNVTNTNVADTTILRGGGYPVAAAPGMADAAGAVAVGAVAAGPAGVVSPATSPLAYATAVAALPCSADPILVNGIHYYQCGSTWFTRSYVDGNVTYVVTNPPG